MVNMKFSFKQILTVFVLISFLAIALFSLNLMTHKQGGRLAGGCLFPTVGQSICPQNIVAAAVHHLSLYHSFLNVPISLGLTIIFICLLLAFLVVLVISPWSPLPKFSSFVRISFDSFNISFFNWKLTRWLALHENSPAIF